MGFSFLLEPDALGRVLWDVEVPVLELEAVRRADVVGGLAEYFSSMLFDDLFEVNVLGIESFEALLVH